MGQSGLKIFHLCHSQKIRIPQAKNLFRMQTRRLAASFEPLMNSSLPLLACELCMCKARAIRLFWCENPQKWPDAKLLRDIA